MIQNFSYVIYYHCFTRGVEMNSESEIHDKYVNGLMQIPSIHHLMLMMSYLMQVFEIMTITDIIKSNCMLSISNLQLENVAPPVNSIFNIMKNTPSKNVKGTVLILLILQREIILMLNYMYKAMRGAF